MPIQLTWTPSQDALDQGIVPEDWHQYDVTTEGLEGDALSNLESTIAIFAQPKFSHVMNNESAAAWISAKKRDKDPLADTVENRAAFLHAYRTKAVAKMLAGDWGQRASSAAPVDELTRIMHRKALIRVAKFVEDAGGTFPYTDVTHAKTLAAKVGDTGMTVKEVITGLMDPDQSPETAAEIRAEAQAELDARNAEKAKVTVNPELMALFAKKPVAQAAK